MISLFKNVIISIQILCSNLYILPAVFLQNIHIILKWYPRTYQLFRNDRWNFYKRYTAVPTLYLEFWSYLFLFYAFVTILSNAVFSLVRNHRNVCNSFKYLDAYSILEYVQLPKFDSWRFLYNDVVREISLLYDVIIFLLLNLELYIWNLSTIYLPVVNIYRILMR